MNDLVCVHDFLHQVTSLLVVHRPDLFDAFVVSFFKLLKAFLELNEFICEPFVVFRVGTVQSFGLSLLHLEKLEFVSQSLVVLLKLLTESFFLLEIHLLTFV